ncbi:hypothetical protein [Bradyrhizobium sp. SYSU BS000235]|uniref:hypothetical protein n=1 Tax=Bradyrhizobium sp. SYSU BS000235 TaxID=3411332 RepID=UPI003C71D94C
MSNVTSGILGAVAATLALGAVHLEVATGNDLVGSAQRTSGTMGIAHAPANVTAVSQNVNRSAKGDRDLAMQPSGGLTISFKVPGANDASVALRMPAGDAADARRKPVQPARLEKGSAVERRQVACEPVVSALTAVAKQLGPGRCIT